MGSAPIGTQVQLLFSIYQSRKSALSVSGAGITDVRMVVGDGSGPVGLF